MDLIEISSEVANEHFDAGMQIIKVAIIKTKNKAN
jgi:hypothetical protein